jgi:hypothetical protein
MRGMMGRPTRFAFCAAGIAVPLILSGCGDSDGSGDQGEAKTSPSQSVSASPASPSASPASPSATGGGTALGGARAGVTLRLPAGWKQVDPVQDGSAVVQTSFGLDGETGPLLRSLMQRQIQQGTVFAIDTSVTSGMAPHLTAGCDRGGAIGASLDQLKRKQQALEPNSRITDLTVGGKPGFKATYESTKRSGPISGLTVRVPVAADRFCFVDIEARQGTLPPAAEAIASSFAPA